MTQTSHTHTLKTFIYIKNSFVFKSINKRKKERKDTEQKICPLVVFGGRVGFLVC
jgi:hypothetical protein